MLSLIGGRGAVLRFVLSRTPICKSGLMHVGVCVLDVVSIAWSKQRYGRDGNFVG